MHFWSRLEKYNYFYDIQIFQGQIIQNFCMQGKEKENFWKVSFPSNILLLIIVENQSKENIIFQST